MAVRSLTVYFRESSKSDPPPSHDLTPRTARVCPPAAARRRDDDHERRKKRAAGGTRNEKELRRVRAGAPFTSLHEAITHFSRADREVSCY